MVLKTVFGLINTVLNTIGIIQQNAYLFLSNQLISSISAVQKDNYSTLKRIRRKLND